MGTQYKVYSSKGTLVGQAMFPVNAVQIAVTFKGSIIKYAPNSGLRWVVWNHSEWYTEELDRRGYWQTCLNHAGEIDKRVEQKLAQSKAHYDKKQMESDRKRRN